MARVFYDALDEYSKKRWTMSQYFKDSQIKNVYVTASSDYSHDLM